MKQVININFHGHVVPIEVSAFDLLKQYTESLSRYFANEEGKEEIINDIESRIGELFQERLKAGSACITDNDVNAIIKSMGRPEEFEDQAPASDQSTAYTKPASMHKRLYRDENDKVLGGVCSGLANYFGIDPIIMRVAFLLVMFAFGTGLLAYIILWVVTPSSSTSEIGGARKRLFRDPDNKAIAGVCSGISNYFGISIWIPRLLFLLPFLGFLLHIGSAHFGGSHHFLGIGRPSALLIYIILWLVLPEATTTAEKLEMKGEKVDMNSIKNSITEEMKGAKASATEKGKAMASDINAATKRNKNALGNMIALFFKVIGYFILGCVGFGLVMGLFFAVVVSIAIFPLKDFFLMTGWQNIFAWGTLLFFIGIPVIGIITWFIRRLANTKTNRTPLRVGFVGLWLVGIFCLACLAMSVLKDFRYSNNKVVEDIALTNPAVNKLEITSIQPNRPFTDSKWFEDDLFNSENQDTLFLNNIDMKIVKSPTDSFRVTAVKSARGYTKNEADASAQTIQLGIAQQDSSLVINRGIAATRKNKFRDQEVILTIYVPVGKQIRIDKNISSGKNLIFTDDGNDDDDDINIENNNSDKDMDYIMQADGLHTLDGKRVGEHDSDHQPDVIIEGDSVKVNTL
ncbi:MAG TPA: PspC domain-containing protein [Ferruginibacter sp.]|nr:PspC domain-containing protein [Ferruginibacter sp.]